MAVFQFFQYRVSILFLIAFLYLFLPKKFNTAKTIGLFSILFLVSGVLEYFQCFYIDNFAPFVTTIITLADIFLVQFFAFFLSSCRDLRALFIGTTAACYVLPGNILSSLLFIYLKNPAIAITFEIVIHVAFIAATYHFFRNTLRNALMSHRNSWGKLLLMPCFFYVIVYTMTIFPGDIYKNPQYGIPSTISLILMAVFFILTIEYFSDRKKQDDLRDSLAYLEKCTETFKSQAQKDFKNREELSIMKHDIRHNVNLLLSYIDSGEIEKVRDLLSHNIKMTDKIVTANFCANITINAVLSEAASTAAKIDTKFNCKALIDDTISINEFELAVVLSNMLENAIEAVSKIKDTQSRYLQLKIYPIKDQLLISCENPYCEKLVFTNDSSLPISQKKGFHSYGLKSVSAFVKKHNAVFDLETDNDVFNIKILVPLKKNCEVK